MAKFTVFGSTGFIGGEFVSELTKKGHDVFTPPKNCSDIFSQDLGIVIYAAGYGQCDVNPYNVLEANTILLSDILRKSEFKKMIYISSTRVYMNQCNSMEGGDLIIDGSDSRRLFNLTKLVAEELCLKSKKKCVVVRPSNVYGLAMNSPLFLPSIIRNAITNGHIDMFVPPNYSKDYVSVIDVVNSVIQLSEVDCSNQIVNIGSGVNVSAKEISTVITNNIKCDIHWNGNNNLEEFPVTDISLIKSLIVYEPRNVLLDMEEMINSYRSEFNKI